MRFENSVTLILKQYEAASFSFFFSELIIKSKKAINFQIKNFTSINDDTSETSPHFCDLEKGSLKSAICFVPEEYFFSFVPNRVKPSYNNYGLLRGMSLLSNRFTTYKCIFRDVSYTYINDKKTFFLRITL